MLKVDFVHILIDGKIVYTGNSELAKEIEENGYNSFKVGEWCQKLDLMN